MLSLVARSSPCLYFEVSKKYLKSVFRTVSGNWVTKIGVKSCINKSIFTELSSKWAGSGGQEGNQNCLHTWHGQAKSFTSRKESDYVCLPEGIICFQSCLVSHVYQQNSSWLSYGELTLQGLPSEVEMSFKKNTKHLLTQCLCLEI